MSRYAIVSALCLLASPAMADQSGASWGVMFGSSNYSQTGFSFDMPTITGRLGYNINRHIGVEGRLGYGASGSDKGVSMGMNWLAGAYAKVRWEVMEGLYVNAIGGYTLADTSAEQATGNLAESDGGPGGGIGFDFYADENSGLNLEWVRYLDSTRYNTSYTIDHIGIGYFQKF